MAKKYLDSEGLLYFWQKIKSAFVTDVTYDSTNRKIQKTKNGSTSDVVTIAKVATSGSYNDLSNKPTIPSGVEKSTTTPKMDGTASVGSETKFAAGDHVHPSDTSRVPTTRKINGLDLTADRDIITQTGAVTSGGAILTTSATELAGKTYDNYEIYDKSAVDGMMNAANAIIAQTYVAKSSVGAASGIAPLDANSKIDATYLPSYVDDVIEAYPRSGQTELSQNWLATGSATGTVITPETGKIYILMADSGDYSANSQFRWSGTTYVKMADGGVSSITNAEIDTIVAA